jgi:hypothetical protein
MRVHYTHGSDPLTRRSTATFTLDRTGKQLFWNIPRWRARRPPAPPARERVAARGAPAAGLV